MGVGGRGVLSVIQGAVFHQLGGWGGAISNTRGCWSSVMERGVVSVTQGAVGHQLWVCVWGGAISNIKGCWSSVMGGVCVCVCVWGGGVLSVTQCSSVLVTKRGKSSPKSKCQTMTQEHLVFVINSLKF